jgi:hypothetical protein
VGTLEDLLSVSKSSCTLPTPDALFISWPTPGRSDLKLIEHFKPKVVIQAYDQAGICGIRKTSYGLEIKDQNWTWWGWGNDPHHDDLDFDPQRPYTRTWSVRSYRDLHSPLVHPQGQLTIHSQVKWMNGTLPSTLPWESSS